MTKTAEIESKYRQRLIQLVGEGSIGPKDDPLENPYILYSILSRNARAKGILAVPDSDDAKALIEIVKFYLLHCPNSPQTKWSKYAIAGAAVEKGYVDNVLLAHLEPWFSLFFKLKKVNVSVAQLQSVLVKAGFSVFDDSAQKLLSARIDTPEKDIYFSQQCIVGALFGERLHTIRVREPGNNELADVVAAILNSIAPPLNITQQDEIWDDAKLAHLAVKPLAENLLGYNIQVPESKAVYCHFDYQGQSYGFFASDDLMGGFFSVMVNIDCFLSFIGRPERMFFIEHDGTEGEVENYVLAEPQAIAALVKQLQVPILSSAEVLAIWADDIARGSCNALEPSISLVDLASVAHIVRAPLVFTRPQVQSQAQPQTPVAPAPKQKVSLIFLLLMPLLLPIVLFRRYPKTMLTLLAFGILMLPILYKSLLNNQ